MKWELIFTRQGQLHRQWTSNIEVLYTGLHGLSVQRFRLKEDGQHYIYKPFATADDVMREVGVYERIMPLLPEVYPQLIAYSAGAAVDAGPKEGEQLSGLQQVSTVSQPGCWLILEDIGELNHRHTDQVLRDVVDLMAQWHSIPTGKIRELPDQGQKPPLSVVRDEVLRDWAQVAQLLTSVQSECTIRCTTMDNGMTEHRAPDEHQLNLLQEQIRHFTISESKVLAHGDLHAGNYGLNPAGRLIILDWEHAHSASPYWDLYHLLDMSHPLFPRRMNQTLRQQLLHRYWSNRWQYPGQEHTAASEWNRSSFIRDYYLYAIVYSLWMLMLIERDLHQSQAIWPHSQLLAQRRETMEHVLQCMKAWYE